MATASPLTVCEYATLYSDRAGFDARQSHRNKLLCAARLLDRYRGQAVKLADLNDDLIRNYVQWLDQRYTAKTVRANRCRIRTLWKAAHAEGLVPTAPKFKPKGPPKKRPDERTSAVQTALAASAASTANREPFTPTLATPLYEYFCRVYVPRRLADARPTTLNHHLVQMRHFRRFLGRQPTLGDLNDDNVIACMLHLLAGNRAAVTVNKLQHVLCALWRHAAAAGIIKSQPDVRELNAPVRVPEAWTHEEMRQLIAGARDWPSHERCGSVPCSLWWPALLLVCYDTAARVSAIVQSDLGDYRPNDGALYIVAEHQKNRRGQVFWLADETQAALQEMLATHDRSTKRLFPWQKNKCLLWKDLTKLLQRAGLPHGRRDKFHRIRRTVATLIEADAPGAATAYLGHSHRRVTEQYIDPSKLPEWRVADRLPRLTGVDADRKGVA